MAERDKGQGFGFVYVDVKKLLDEARTRVATAKPSEASEENKPADVTAPSTTVAAPVNWPTPGAKVLNFNRDQETSQGAATLPLPAVTTQNPTAALKQIRQSLDRLQALHHKLHAVLAELSHATDRDKKK